MNAPTDIGTSDESIIPVAREAMALVRAGQARQALDMLRARPVQWLSAAEVRPASRLVSAVAAALPELPGLKVAFGGDATLDDLVAAIGWYLLVEGIRLEPLILPFGGWRQALRDPTSSIHEFEPDVLWLLSDSRTLRDAPAMGRTPADAADELRSELLDLCSAWQANHTSQLVLSNLVPTAWRTMGNLEPLQSGSEARAVRGFNDSLAANLPPGALLFDLEHLASSYGLASWQDDRLYAHSKHPFAMAAHGMVGHGIARQLLAIRGRSRKCLVLDLDNTLWGGVVGDDGPEGISIGPNGGARGESFAAFQRWVKAMSHAGIVLAVCSKNDDVVVRRAFAETTGMVLALDDFAAIRANWRNKADNLRELAAELNLGLDSFVFVDDNPAERALVRRELPEVAVPELPSDPAGYVAAVARGRWFESVAITEEDLARSRAYRDNRLRDEARVTATDLPSYLRSLQMRSRWGDVDTATLARAAQLINKTNQFQLTGARYTEAELAALCARDDRWVGWFQLADRFGDHGITSVVVLAFTPGEALIDTWVMSCRVFARSFEQFVFNRVVEVSRSRGADRLRGVYRPTPKNEVVRELYPQLGGARDGTSEIDSWEFSLVAELPLVETHIFDQVD